MTPRYCLTCPKRIKLAHRQCYTCRLDQAQATRPKREGKS